MTKKKQIVITAVLIFLLILLACVWIYKNNTPQKTLYDVYIYGDVLACSDNSFVLQNESPMDRQEFYVFCVNESTNLNDSDGNPIALKDMKPGMNVEVVYQTYDSSETFEVLSTEIKILTRN